MPVYEAFWRKYKHDVVVKLHFGIVSRITTHQGIVTAYMYDPSDPDGRLFKFRVSKPDNPCGSRHNVRALNRRMIPTIGRDKADFEVHDGSNGACGTTVLFIKPHRGSAAFPVVSWDDYQEALRELNRTTPAIEVVPAHKHDHRWVDPPPHQAPK